MQGAHLLVGSGAEDDREAATDRSSAIQAGKDVNQETAEACVTYQDALRDALQQGSDDDIAVAARRAHQAGAAE